MSTSAFGLRLKDCCQMLSQVSVDSRVNNVYIPIILSLSWCSLSLCWQSYSWLWKTHITVLGVLLNCSWLHTQDPAVKFTLLPHLRKSPKTILVAGSSQTCTPHESKYDGKLWLIQTHTGFFNVRKIFSSVGCSDHWCQRHNFCVRSFSWVWRHFIKHTGMGKKALLYTSDKKQQWNSQDLKV